MHYELTNSRVHLWMVIALLAVSFCNWRALVTTGNARPAEEATSQDDEILRCKGIEIIDDRGHVRVSIRVPSPTNSQVVMTFFNSAAERRLEFSVSDLRGHIALFERGDQIEPRILLEDSGTAMLISKTGNQAGVQLVAGFPICSITSGGNIAASLGLKPGGKVTTILETLGKDDQQ